VLSCYSCLKLREAFIYAFLFISRASLLITRVILIFQPIIMSEQDTYASHLGISPDRVEAARKKYDLGHSTGSEQERYASHFTWKRLDKSVDTAWGPAAAQPVAPAAAIGAESEQEILNSHFSLPSRHTVDTSAVGILRSTLLPSLGLQSGLSIIAYTGSRLTNRVDGKDWIWPAGQVLNAWWSAIGSKIVSENVDASTAWSELDYPLKLILFGVTIWGGRLFYRVVSRSISRGHDDPRYESAKAEPDFWNKSLFSIYLPEALFQTLISLPFTLPFKETQLGFTPYPVPACAEFATGLGVFLFGAGFALEVLADSQLAAHNEKNQDLDTAGVWSIVRHPQ
jgi:steroid 5-alpha reductase family enzyme